MCPNVLYLSISVHVLLIILTITYLSGLLLLLDRINEAKLSHSHTTSRAPSIFVETRPSSPAAL